MEAFSARFEKEPSPEGKVEKNPPTAMQTKIEEVLREVLTPLRFEFVRVRTETSVLTGWNVYKKGSERDYPDTIILLHPVSDWIVALSRDREANEGVELMFGLVVDGLRKLGLDDIFEGYYRIE